MNESNALFFHKVIDPRVQRRIDCAIAYSELDDKTCTSVFYNYFHVSNAMQLGWALNWLFTVFVFLIEFWIVVRVSIDC